MKSNHLGAVLLVGALLYVGVSTYLVGSTPVEAEAEASQPLAEAPIPVEGTRWVFLKGEPIDGDLTCTQGELKKQCVASLFKDRMHPGKCYVWIGCYPCLPIGWVPDWTPCPSE